MDSRKLKGLCDTVLKFKSALNDTLKSENGEFHVAVNGDKPLMFEGLTQSIQDDPNSYSVEISDLLFWHDPEAYMDEMERWEGQLVKDQHVEMLEYLEESEQSAVFSKLVETIKKKRIAPFVGAGLSKSCNFPLWGEAIEKLVNKLEITYRRESDLLPYINNARTHSPEQILQLKSSIEEFGMCTAIGIHNNTIVYGHARFEALKQLGYKSFPTVDLSYLTETQMKAYILADNKLVKRKLIENSETQFFYALGKNQYHQIIERGKAEKFNSQTKLNLPSVELDPEVK